ncbi:MAG: phosphotransferase [Chloroflexi bacterium]|nr:phosphotransferase [Chloroflexota bacterium]MCH8309761.1 phosphotransferase [Chloroflexota bacterium]
MRLTPEHAQHILRTVSSDLTLVSITPVRAAFTNEVRILECRTPSGNTLRLVVKLLTDDPEDAARRASADFHGLQIARAHGIPAPEPIFLDPTGEVLGVPGIVTRFVEGRQIAAPENVRDWAESLADLLLRIHSVRPNEDERRHLYVGNELGLYFLTGDWPEKMAGHPLSDTIYDAVRELRSGIERLPAVFVHMDYWPGNVLWREGRISAALDWDAAGYGDPALDVAYFRMNMHLRGIKEAADIFLDRYEAESGARVRNLGFWELARAAGPLPNPARWIPASREMGDAGSTDDRADTDYYEFVANARRRAYTGR